LATFAAAAAAYSTGVIQPSDVRTALVIVLTPSLDLGSGVGDGQETMHVQAIVAKAAVE